MSELHPTILAHMQNFLQSFKTFSSDMSEKIYTGL